MARRLRTWIGRLNSPVWGRRDGPEHYLIYATLTDAGSVGRATGRPVEIRITKRQAAYIADRFSEWQKERPDVRPERLSA